MKVVTKKFYADPGHGWLAVKFKELKELGIAHRITCYSYVRGQTVYLEEDCDATTYARALENHNVVLKTEVKHTNKRSPIRSYQPYRPILSEELTR